MKKFIKYLIGFIGIIITTFIITTILVESILIREMKNNDSESTIKKLAENSANCKIEKNDIMIKKQNEDDGIWRPVIEGKIAYCVEPGISLFTSVYTPKEDIKKLVDDYNKNPTTKSSCGCPGNIPHYGERSGTYYVCTGNDYDESSKFHVQKRLKKDSRKDDIVEDYWTDNLYDIGYILSYELDTTRYENIDEESWEGAKQQAIWQSPISEIKNVEHTENLGEGEQIRKESLQYKDFRTQVKANDDKVFKKDNTNVENVKLDVDNTETKLHKLGPFNIDYVYGTYTGGYSYGGISDMYLTDKNGKRIEIQNFIRPSKYSQEYSVKNKDAEEEKRTHIIYSSLMRPNFFDVKDLNNEDNPNKVNYFGYMSYYPQPNEDFYVEFNYDKDISYMELHIEFKRLECKAEFCLREAQYWQVGEKCNHTPVARCHCSKTAHSHSIANGCYDLDCSTEVHSHTESCKNEAGEMVCGKDEHSHSRANGCYDLDCSTPEHTHNGTSCTYVSHYKCTKTASLETVKDPQNGILVGDTSREIVGEDEVVIKINKQSKTRMKIGGFVFEDVPAGKENIANGIMDEGTDLKLKNIEVTLYDASTNQPAKLSSLKEERNYEIDKYKQIYEKYKNNRRVSKEDLAIIKNMIESSLYDNLYKKSQTNTIITTKEQERLLEQLKKAIDDIEKEANDPNDYMRRINPTLTDEKGYYEFRGVDPEKKYYLKFTYNGQIYTCTDYLKVKDTVYASVKDMVDRDSYQKVLNDNTSVIANEKWKNTSKGTELKTDREKYDGKFASIYSSPDNYSIKDSPLKLIVGDTNKTFNIYELSGITLGSDGKYEYNEADQLIDSNLVVDKDGKVIEGKDYKDGIINKTIKAYIKNEYKDNENHNYPTDVRTQIYKRIAKPSDDILWEKFQFIEDCKISSYTKSSNTEDINKYDLYPVYDQFTLSDSGQKVYPDNSYDSGTYAEVSGANTDKTVYQNHTLKDNGSRTIKTFNTGKKDTTINYIESKGSITYKNVYPGQLLINQGLWRRQQVDVSLRKDVYKATLTVNGKTETYKYNSRSQVTADQMKKLIELKEAYNVVKGQNNEAEAKASNEYSNYLNSLSNTYWDIQAKIKDYPNYYGEKYYRELYESDYNFPGAANGENKLKAYITYQITICNNSQSILTQINEVVDYYDREGYEFIQDKSWMMYVDDSTTGTDYMNGITVPDQDFYDIMTGDIEVKQGTNYKPVTTRTGKNSTADFDGEFNDKGYNTLYVKGPEGKKLQSGEELYLYLTFKVNGSGKDLKVENSTDPDKKNIAEINGYSTFYKEGTKLPNGKSIDDNNTPAGIIDQDSNPGNFRAEYIPDNNEEIYEHYFEDDTDRARGIRIPPPDISSPDEEGGYSRKISGNVWEDYRTEPVGGAYIGNGLRENGEPLIKGIKVELLEVILDNNGNPTVDSNGDVKISTKQTTYTDEKGHYEFSDMIPGDYIVRFTYGGQYNAKYNGQDYKSTSYQVGIEQEITQPDGTKKAKRTDVAKEGTNGYYSYTDLGNYNGNKGQNVSGSYGYDIYAADTNNNGNVSDAKDLWRTRASVNSYSSSNYQGVTYDLANTLSKNEQPNNNTQMIAETGVIRLEFEYNRQNSNANTVKNSNGVVKTEGDKVNNNGYTGTTTGKDSYTGNNNSSTNNFNGTYHIENVDLGLEERPKAQLKLTKEVVGVKVILANGNVAVDSTPKNTAGTATWTPIVDNEIKSEIGEANTYRMVVTAQDNSKKLVSIIMDDELMHGASIGITYNITVTNVGEIDYADTIFYYKGAEGSAGDLGTIVKTSANVILDYVPNNLQFRTTDNPNGGWSVIDNNTITSTSNGYLTSRLTTEPTSNTDTNQNVLNKFNTIIQNTGLNKDLVPNIADNTATKEKSVTTKQLVLSQLMTAQNTDDDRVYENIAEIVKISNTVGRRMAFSIQGNQNPLAEPAEIDSFKAESVRVLPPFGIGNIITYIAIALTSLGVLVTGIIIIKKKVINK